MTSRDPRSWDDPDRFLPERFLGRAEDPFASVPQGGGDHATGHRCPGEWLTVAVMKAAALFLVREMDYTVPAQDLGIDERRVPALPRSQYRRTSVAAPVRPFYGPRGDQPATKRA